MGVQGLTSLLEEHGRVLRDVKFRDSRLIIDGANLLHLLYVDSGESLKPTCTNHAPYTPVSRKIRLNVKTFEKLMTRKFNNFCMLQYDFFI
uniref:XPG N-terminal domain-containing protein n=1 Tax=Salarias fasciatus TaxID=181472 RepID=A0A672GPY4_SALFA